MLRFNEYGYLPEGDHEMTISELKESILVLGDESTYQWKEGHRRYLVNNLEHLIQPLWTIGIESVYIDGSFCTDKETPKDIDAYFEFPDDGKTRAQILQELIALAHELNSLSEDGLWNWWERRPNSDFESKPEMWFKYQIEIYPNCFGVYATKDGKKFDQMFRQDKNGFPKGVIKLIKG
ncbi:DUF6932 family protein [Thermoflavimicrobium daqui]|jgi:hypothetical protein|uniref:Uncharacterized protein n=1 Tax=Thermoflavimicrobium daqui TaxID=2137476 RepID=A0A364K1S2_9BACL|nr:hypothetical protein [Thermoflavimicrobium daqui]RAL21974.1 hypothetical protein DL897_15435 [Thermoflavimicrobium daqui]